MRRLLAAVLTCLGCAGAACGSEGPSTADLVLVDVTVIDVRDGTLTPDRSVFVEGGRITAVLPSSRASVPAGAVEVDGSGRYVIPGLWDTHVHSAGAAGWHFPLMVAHGITSVRNMHATVDTALQLTQAIARRTVTGDLVGPRFLANGPIIDGYPPTWPGTVVARTAAEGRAAVDSLAAGGADFIKVYDALTPEVFRAITDEARAVGIPVDGHVPMLVPAVDAATAGMRTVEHTSGITMGCSSRADSIRAEYANYLSIVPTLRFPANLIGFFSLVRAAVDTHDPAACDRVVQAYLEHGVTVVPTLVISTAADQIQDPARQELLPAAIRDEWLGMLSQGGDPVDALMSGTDDVTVDNVRRLHEAGVPVLAGTDVGNPFLVPGRSLHDELGALVHDVGFTPLAALQSATVEPARVFGLSDSLGVIEAGMLADLVILEANPLEEIEAARSIVSVILHGRYLDRAALDDLLTRARDYQ